jgi:hypothetical protein
MYESRYRSSDILAQFVFWHISFPSFRFNF